MSIDRARLALLWERETRRFEVERPRSKALFEKAAKRMPDGVPMLWMAKWPGPWPVYVDVAEGSHFRCVDGIDHVDLCLGDTGAMGLGGALAALAILSRTEILLIFIGGLFVIVTGSVILQRAYFKISGGKRIFLMSPLHHHFELKGWAEITVVVRFWIISGLSVLTGIGLFYLEWIYG